MAYGLFPTTIWNMMPPFGVTLDMRPKKLVSALALSAFILVVLAAGAYAFLRQQNLAVLHRGEHILDEANQLRIDKSDLAEVLRYAKKFDGEERSSHPNASCTPDDCLLTVYALPSDFISRHPSLIEITDRLGIHPLHVHVSMWVQDGKLAAMEEVFVAPKALDGLSVTVASSRAPADACNHRSYRMHPAYMTSLRTTHGQGTFPQFEYWTNAEKQGLPRMNLSCAGSVRGCTAIAQILPIEWEQFITDEKKLNSTVADTSSGDAVCAK